MVTYVERLKDEGRARPEADARLVTQTLFGSLFGSLFAYDLARNLLQAPWLADVGSDVVAAHVADIVARGIALDEVDPQARPVEEVERGHQDAGAHS